MERKVYVKACSQISLLQGDPDYTRLFPPLEARRLSRLMKRALAVSRRTLDKAGVAAPDGIITGTGLGCIENTEHFLKSLTGVSDAPLRPTHFMQSTHNTISSLIAIRLSCHGYNATYSHGAVSFESALLDAFVQLRLGMLGKVLVGAFEEMTPDFAAMLAKTGRTAVRVGDRLSETAASLLLDTDPAGALCELVSVELDSFRADILSPSQKNARSTEYQSLRSTLIEKYGDNDCVTALGACDAVAMIASGACEAVRLDNFIPGKTSATLLFRKVCGR